MDSEQSLAQFSQRAELDNTWRGRVLLIGGLIGAMVGLLSALFYIRAAEETGKTGKMPEAPVARDAVRLGLSLLGIMRTITEWGTRRSTSDE